MIALLVSMFIGTDVFAQCLTLPNALENQLSFSNNIIEGKVVGQQSFIGNDGNIYTRNRVDVYRVFKGNAGFTAEVVTEGGVYGDLMQVVTPSAQMQIGDYGVMILDDDQAREINSVASAFYSIDERNNEVFGLPNVFEREALYDIVARSTGTSAIQLLRVPQVATMSGDRDIPQVSAVSPLNVTAGTQTLLTITGEGFGNTRGEGSVAFRNANDGGQTFVTVSSDAHYVSWTDSQIEMYVPSASLFNSTVAGTGSLRIINTSGSSVTSTQQLSVNYAKSEVVYSGNLNETMLVDVQNGGYEFTINQNILALLDGSQLIDQLVEKWACNTGVNFKLGTGYTGSNAYANDEVNILGLSAPGQLPSYLLGRTVTTFSSCGTADGLQWNMIDVDILLNTDINWWISESQPMNNRFDLTTAVLHELGHAHLLQHNNNPSSPMYFQLTEGFMRRDLDVIADVEGGEYIAVGSTNAETTCGDAHHEMYDFSDCNLSLINGVEGVQTNEYEVYPNPFTNEVIITSEWQKGDNYSIFDATGRMVDLGDINSGNHTIHTSSLSKGMYLLELTGQLRKEVRRLIKN